MAIARQGSSSGGNNSGVTNSLTISYSVNALSDFLIVALLGDTQTNDDVTGVTYNGVSMVLASKYIPSANDNTRCTYIYYLLNPATGANNIVASSTSSHWL